MAGPRKKRRRSGTNEPESPDQLIQLPDDFAPFIGIWQWIVRPCDRWPDPREFGVQADELLLAGRNVLLGVDRLDRTLGDADRTVRSEERRVGKERLRRWAQ